MSDAEPRTVGLDPEVLKSLEPAQVGAALSKLFAASIGDIVVVLSRSSAYKHYYLADIEWMVLPPVSAGQFYVVEAADKERGFRTPVAVVTWAYVSEEMDRGLQEQLGHHLRLRPDQWKSGEIGWLVDAVGTPAGVRAALQWLAAGPFKQRALNVIVRDAHGTASITTLAALMAVRAEAGSATA
jgi:cytolysin-activating lysine-acyltransferase